MAAVQNWPPAQPAGAWCVVTHGGVLDMLWRTAHGLPLDGCAPARSRTPG
jgi:broad specificity phosphatase PhoE